jgi:hypothetical protein
MGRKTSPAPVVVTPREEEPPVERTPRRVELKRQPTIASAESSSDTARHQTTALPPGCRNIGVSGVFKLRHLLDGARIRWL